MNTRSIYRVQTIFLLLYIAAAIVLWPGLPEKIPLHFDFSGNVTDWATTSIFSWFGLPIIAVLVTLLLHGAGRLAARSPSLWNIPEKKLFLALAPERRAPIEEYMRRLLAWTALFVTFIFIAVHAGIYMTAIERRSPQPWVMLLLVLVPTTVLLVLALRMSAHAGEMVRRASGDDRDLGRSNG